MVALVARFVMVLGLVGVLGSAAPRPAGVHCRSDDQPTASHHQHQDHHGQKDTGAAEQCPHCPPAECRRHSACDAGADSAVTIAQAAPAAPASSDRIFAIDPDRAGLRSAPPTPPPQSLL